MTISTTSTFTCDRDGVVSALVEAAENMSSVTHPPDGWLRILWDGVTIGEPQLKSGSGYLCPACVAAFKEWLGMPAAGTLP